LKKRRMSPEIRNPPTSTTGIKSSCKSIKRCCLKSSL
jgi:hypothetical protein